jgi:hypothetical protein
MSFDTPILLIVFNRPDTTKRVFEKVREIKPSKLFVAADGPRPANPGERELCSEVRSIVLNNVDWPCEVKTFFREKNLGCGIGPSEAITWFFDHVEEGIILEDDIIPSNSFFEFATRLLSIYKNDETVWHIGGNSYNPYPLQNEYYFSVYPHVWGWATWRRAWKNYRFTIDDIDQQLLFRNIEQLFLTEAEKSYWKKTFIKYLHMKDQSVWDYQWTFRMWYNKRLAILPKVNLINNIGFEVNATHTTDKDSWLANLTANEIEIPKEKLPVKQNKKADLFTSKKIFFVKAAIPQMVDDMKKVIKDILKRN